MRTNQLALELERKLSAAVHGVARGNYDYMLCSGQSKNPIFNDIHQPLLDLIPEIEKLAAQIKEEVSTARANTEEL